MVWGFISALVACCGVGLLPCWFVGLLVCWLVALLVFWFVGCLFVGCLAPESKARGRVARRAVRSGAPVRVQLCWTPCRILQVPSGMFKLQAIRGVSLAHPYPGFVATWTNLALCWSNLAVLSVMFVHLVHLGSYLTPTWPICAPTWPNFPPTWPNLVASWPNLPPTWSNFGPNLAPKSDQDELQEVVSSLSKRSSVFY